MTQGNGTVTKNYQYDAFGNEVDPDLNDLNPFRYCGEYFDKETDSYYLRARNYQPGLGRFMTEDTVTALYDEMPNGQEIDDPLSLNLYTYGHNNPIMYIDPSGNVVTYWDRTHLSDTEIATLQFYSDNWSKVSKAIQDIYRAEAERMRSKYRMPYEYTTVEGYTLIDNAKYVEYIQSQAVSQSSNTGNFAGTLAVAGAAAAIDGPIPAGDVIAVGIVIAFFATNSKKDIDPYARPGQKKQGRELKEKKKNDPEKWTGNPNKRKKPPKKHTPSPDHKKYKH